MTTPAVRRYTRSLLLEMAVYTVLLLVSVYALTAVQTLWLRVLLALLPVVPIAFAARSVLRFVRECDELQRRILLEAFSLASLALTLVCFTLGLLALAGVVRINGGLALTMVMPAYCLFYGVFVFFATRRYQ